MESYSLSIAYDGLIKYYDNLIKQNKCVCPIAHTYISVHIGVLLDKNGNFLCAMKPEIKELIPAPCTVQSETRTSNIAPHLLHDNLCYVADYSPKYKSRHEAYIKQLKNYIDSCHDDLYAKAIYDYVSNETLMHDIKNILDKFKITSTPKEKLNILFCVYGMDNEGASFEWQKWYLSQLKQNGICCITGKRDYIPQSYPKCVISPNGNEVLFASNSHVGYVAAQKITHAIQYLSYAKANAEQAKILYKFQDFSHGDITETDFLTWIKNNYPDKYSKFKDLIKI